MDSVYDFCANNSVALLAEGVDRNTKAMKTQNATERSPSSRRAWIEMLAFHLAVRTACVALLAEGVDRNNRPVIINSGYRSRPPRGGRG